MASQRARRTHHLGQARRPRRYGTVDRQKAIVLGVQHEDQAQHEGQEARVDVLAAAIGRRSHDNATGGADGGSHERAGRPEQLAGVGERERERLAQLIFFGLDEVRASGSSSCTLRDSTDPARLYAAWYRTFVPERARSGVRDATRNAASISFGGGPIHRALVRRHPYAVFFRIRSEPVVVVLAVMHQRRDPATWPR